MRLRSLPGYPALLVDYAEDAESARPFFPFRPDRLTLLSRAGRAAKKSTPPGEICRLLRQQAEELSAGDRVLENIRLLAQPGTVVVLTSVPPILLGGPLAIILKCLTAVKLASELGQNGITAVPLAWLQPVEDPRLKAPVVLLDADSNPVRLTLGEGSLDAVGDILKKFINTGGSLWNHDVIHDVEDSFARGGSSREAAMAFLARISNPWGLIWLDAAKPAFRALAEPILLRIQKDPARGAASMNSHSGKLAQAGYAIDSRWGEDAVQYLIDACLVQDSLFPVAAIVAGALDFAACTLALQVFRDIRVEPPLLWPRVSATIVDARTRKTVERCGLAVEDLFSGTEGTLRKAGMEQTQLATLSRFDELIASVEAGIRKISALAQEDGLQRDVESSREKILYQLSRLRERLASAGAVRKDAVIRQLRRACNLVLPESSPQECELASLYFLLRYSRAILDQVYDRMNVWTHEHQILDVD